MNDKQIIKHLLKVPPTSKKMSGKDWVQATKERITKCRAHEDHLANTPQGLCFCTYKGLNNNVL